MKYTENYNLKKPESGDYYNVEDFNENSDTIDANLLVANQAYEQVQALQAAIASLEESVAGLEKRAKVRLTFYAPHNSSIVLSKSGEADKKIAIPKTYYYLTTLSAAGTWTATITSNGVTATKKVEVNNCGDNFAVWAPALEDCDWAFINAVSQAGLAEECWSVGDTKTITVGSESAVVRILDFGYDKLSPQGEGRGGTAGITFGLCEPLADLVALDANAVETWGERDIFTTVLPAKKALLESALQKVIKSVEKVVLIPMSGTDASSGGTFNIGMEMVTTDLFILSEREIFGAARISNPYYSYEKAYEYYRRGNAFAIGSEYWLRSQPYTSGSGLTAAVYVDAEGKVFYSGLAKEKGLLFGFCV